MRARPIPSRFAWVTHLALAVLLLTCAGCRDPLVGLDDMVVRFAITDGATAPDDLREHVIERLAAADLAAEVDASKPGELTLRVDKDVAEATGRLLLWPGGVTLAVVDDDAVKGVSPASGAPRALVAEALTRATPPAGRIFAIEPLPNGLARPHALQWPALVDVDTSQALADGRRVRVPLPPTAQAKIATLAHDRPRSLVAITRGRTVLAVVSPSSALDDHRLTIPFGTSIAAFTEAAEMARLLATPRLPALRELSHGPANPDWLLASANLILPIAISFAWLFFVRQFDRAQPEPLWLVVATFALGAVAVVPAGLLEWGWDTLSPYTNPTLLTLGRDPRAFPIALAGFVVTVGVSEEGMKLLAAWSLATHRREFDEPVDGIVYGAAAALGFAAAENIRYLALGRVDGPLVASRAFMSVPAHLFFGTIWGYALGRRLVHPERRVWPLFLGAAALHGLFDTCLSIDGAEAWAFVVALGVASLFIVHLRSALRYGPVTHEDDSTVRGARESFRMGSRRVFAGFVVIVYTFSGAVFMLALFGHDGHAGVAFGLPFGVASATALAVLGWAARGVAASLPLDAVVDERGVTFAGAAIRYGDVVRVERRRLLGSPRRQEEIRIIGATRQLTLGPANRETIDSLSHAIAARLGTARSAE
jgi:RsiW-degrading membrane proteinase PrsW (M82 family)